jgi:hypothetical protein
MGIPLQNKTLVPSQVGFSFLISPYLNQLHISTMGCKSSKPEEAAEPASGFQVQELASALPRYRDQPRWPAPANTPQPQERRGLTAPSSQHQSSVPFSENLTASHKQQEQQQQQQQQQQQRPIPPARFSNAHERHTRRQGEPIPLGQAAGSFSPSSLELGTPPSSLHPKLCHCMKCRPIFYTDGRLRAERLNHRVLGCRCQFCKQRRAAFHSTPEPSG